MSVHWEHPARWLPRSYERRNIQSALVQKTKGSLSQRVYCHLYPRHTVLTQDAMVRPQYRASRDTPGYTLYDRARSCDGSGARHFACWYASVSVRIFLSTVSDEFRDYRDQLRRDLTRHNVEVKVQEDFKDLGSVTLDKLDVYIAACDAVVHFVGDMTGAAAKAESTKAIVGKYADLTDKLPPLRRPLENRLDISYTQWEAWLALYHDC
jgi:hypothetical protein